MLSIISAGTTVVGELIGEGDIRIDGIVEGTVKGRTLVVNQGAHVEGNLVADAIRIAGSINGRVDANTVDIENTATVVGSVFHHKLSVESGALLEGLRPWRPLRQLVG